MTGLEPTMLKAEIVRGPHRSTVFQLMFDISRLMDDEGRPLVSGEELEQLLYEWCKRGVLQSLERGRATVPGHP